MGRRRYSWLAYLLTLTLLFGAAVWYTRYSLGQQAAAERESDRRWCQLLTTLDEAYSAAPPTTPTGRRLAGDIHQLRAELGCGTGKS